MDALIMKRRSHVMDQKTAVYEVPTKEVELRRLFTIVRGQAHLHVCLARLEDRIVIPSRRRLKDLPALSRLGKINKSLLDLQTLLLELLIPAPDGLSKTLDDVEIHLKSPRYPETRRVLDAHRLTSYVEALLYEDSCSSKLVHQLLDVRFHTVSKLKCCVGS